MLYTCLHANLKINVLNPIIHVLCLYNTHLCLLHVKPTKALNIIKLGLSRGMEMTLHTKGPPFVRKSLSLQTPLSPKSSLSSQTHPKPINKHATSLISSFQSLRLTLKRSETLFAIRSHFSTESTFFFHFPYIFLHFVSFF
ncbi:hypothetical protein Hanom_Chr01g00075391 [Helianthus anomalus]